MIPIVTPAEMAAVDAAAPEPVEVLVGRAGRAVARSAVRMLGGTYGRRVVVLAGSGHNGADGRVAAAVLAGRGVRAAVVDVADAADAADGLPDADLVIDAAFGTGLSRPWEPPPATAPVLAVDIPSGVDGLTGECRGSPWAAAVTVTFAALKPGLLIGDGPRLAGDVEVADIGLDVGSPRAALATGADVAAVVPERDPDAHKWHSAVRVVAGSPGMSGAAALVAGAAARAGSGMVVVSAAGGPAPEGIPVECVGRDTSPDGWVGDVLDDLDRFGALVVGPGVGRSPEVLAAVAELIERAPVPVVADADALVALAEHPGAVRGRSLPTVLTPHAGEFARLTGGPPAADRFDAVRSLAADLGAVALLKGSTTLVADPDGVVVAVAEGDERLATAGTGDVLAGAIGALVASGAEATPAAWAGAFVHGRAARRLPRRGLLAGDVRDILGVTLGDLR